MVPRILNLAPDGASHCCRVAPGKEPEYPLHRRLNGFESCCKTQLDT
jgi:hypothetical protein